MTSAVSIQRFDHLRCGVELWQWPFEHDRKAEIDAHWRDLLLRHPRLFNGRVMLSHRQTLEQVDAHSIWRSDWFETDYAAFMAWRGLGCPETGVRNGFAMAALQGNDGAFVLARMGDHTANPGRIYFACGTPDPDDVTGNVLDFEGSAIRELLEETSLTMDEISCEQGWTLVEVGPRLAFFKPVRVDLPGRELAREIESRLLRQDDPELSGMFVVESGRDLDSQRMPDFILAYLRHVMAGVDQPG